MNQYLPSKGDLVLIKQVPVWNGRGSYKPTNDWNYLVDNIYEVEEPWGGPKDDRFMIKAYNSEGIRTGAPLFPLDEDYYELIFTK